MCFVLRYINYISHISYISYISYMHHISLPHNNSPVPPIGGTGLLLCGRLMWCM